MTGDAPAIGEMRAAIGRGDYAKALELATEVEEFWDSQQCGCSDLEEAALAVQFCQGVLADQQLRASIDEDSHPDDDDN